MIRGLFVLGLLACSGDPAVDAPTSPPALEAPCRSGCASPVPAEYAHLGDPGIAALLVQLAHDAVGAPSEAADTLLFNGPEVLDHLDRLGAGGLSADEERWLRLQIGRDEVDIGLRLVSETGEILGQREDLVPLAQKQHLLLQGVGTLGRVDINGQVRRVGVKHLWARF